MMPKILIVDDKSSLREQLKKEYEQKGFEVFTAASVGEAKRLIEKEHFDIILTDLYFRRPKSPIALPFGIALCRYCRQRGIKSRLILHSTAFTHRWSRPFHLWVEWWANKRGIEVRKKPLAKLAVTLRRRHRA